MDYNATEAVDMLVEVCVEVITGTVNQIATVEVETLSGTATGGLVIMCIIETGYCLIYNLKSGQF